MDFNECDIENVSLPISMADFFAKNLTPKQKKICEILKTFNEDSVAIYMAGIAILQIKDFPAKQSVTSHCFRELINAISRREESALKQQALEGLKVIEFIKNANNEHKRLENTLNKIWTELKSLNNEKSKLVSMFWDRNPKKKQEMLTADTEHKERLLNDVQGIINNVIAAKGRIDKLRHFDKQFSTLPQEQFEENIDILENYILSLEDAQYMERKESLDGILAATNTRRD